MARGDRWAARWSRFLDRRAVARAVRRGRPTPLVVSPEPRSIGRASRGRQLVSGRFLLGGEVIEAPDASIWDLGPPEAPFQPELQEFAWLEDLAALGDGAARARAQAWTFDWIARYGRGRGPGWTAPITARRLGRLIHHCAFLLRGRDEADRGRFLAALAAQTLFLGQRWRSVAAGLPRIEVLSGVIQAGLALEGMQRQAWPAIPALAHDCMRLVDHEGGLASRNPEDLLEVLTRLTWTVETLGAARRKVPEPLTAAIARIAPTLRALRHSDGALARFHGGGRGVEGRADQALAASGVRARAQDGSAMGFRRMQGGRTSLIVDAAPPPIGVASAEGHASTLAFELTSGRRPLVVNCGSGRSFGAEWRRAGRATPSHSTLGLDGVSSARLAPAGIGNAAGWLADGPRQVLAVPSRTEEGMRLELSHDGWRASHGLTHARTLDLGSDGRSLSGEDILTTLSEADGERFDRAMARVNLQGIAFSIRFHLHPRVEAELDPGGGTVTLQLPSGEVWTFRGDDAAKLALERSVYLESGRLRPRASKQVVLSGRALAYATRVRWSLAKTQDTPDALRDTAPHGARDEAEDH